MKITTTTPLCRQLGVEHPIFAFSHSVEVTVEVTRAGGFAVLGVARDEPQEITRMLAEVRAAIGSRPFGVDVMFPKIEGQPETVEEMKKQLPPAHVRFVERLFEKYAVPVATRPHFFTQTVRSQRFFEAQLDAVLASDVDLVAMAVGVPPEVVARIRAAGKTSLALVGAPRHAQAALAAGVDILVAQGADAGGHTGSIGTFTLVPQIVELAGDVPVIAAGGIGHGRQVAASLAMGAQGAWLGTAWLTTREHALSDVLVDKLLAAGSDDTLISRAHSGKPCRLLKTAWTEEWHASDAPPPLAMPYQQALVGGLFAAVEEHEVRALLYTPAGQSVAWCREREGVSDVMQRLMRQTRDALGALAQG